MPEIPKHRKPDRDTTIYLKKSPRRAPKPGNTLVWGFEPQACGTAPLLLQPPMVLCQAALTHRQLPDRYWGPPVSLALCQVFRAISSFQRPGGIVILLLLYQKEGLKSTALASGKHSFKHTAAWLQKPCSWQATSPHLWSMSLARESTRLWYLLTLKNLNPFLMEIIHDERQIHNGWKKNV